METIAKIILALKMIKEWNYLNTNKALICAINLALFSCSPNKYGDSVKYLVGDNFSQQKNYLQNSSDSKSLVVFYDKRLKRVTGLDFNSQNRFASYKSESVLEDGGLYYLSLGKKYIVDIDLNRIKVFQSESQNIIEVATFPASVASAVFNEDKGFVVVNDILQNIYLFRFSQNGNLNGQIKIGLSPNNDNYTVSCGDIDSYGNLILFLKTPDSPFGKIQIVDIQKSIELQSHQIISEFSISLNDMIWLASIPNSKGKLLFFTNSKYGILDVYTHSIVTSNLEGFSEITMATRNGLPHLVFGDSLSHNTILVYPKSDFTLSKKIINRFEQNFTSSRLDLEFNQWALLVGKNPNDKLKDREVRYYRLDDMLVTQIQKVPDEPKILVGVNKYFELYPYILGYAVARDFFTNKSSEIKLFNLDFIR